MTELQQEWTDKIATWKVSGQSMAAWCRQNDESYDRFVYWRRRLEPGPQRQGRFVALTVQPAALLLSCNGMTLHIERGFDRELLRDVLSVLRAV